MKRSWDGAHPKLTVAPLSALAERRKACKAGPSHIGETGFEPATARPPAGCATRLRHSPWLSRKRATGIEPALEAWKASVQPQHIARSGRPDDTREEPVPRAGEESAVCGNNQLMQIPGVHIETLHNPTRYSYAQIEKACTLAALLNRGKLVLVEPPRNR